MRKNDSSEHFKGFLLRFQCPTSAFSIVIEDDCRVGYGYIYNEADRICGDVWLYNRHETPVEPEWDHKELLPFLNDFCHAGDGKDFAAPLNGLEFSVEWTRQNEKPAAKIFIRSRFHALLVDGCKPGWCVLALKNGPLAKRVSP